MKVGKPESLGEMNKNLILELLRKNGPLSRAQISRRLEMSFPSVSANVKNLIGNGLIKEIGEGDNSLGRKATLLQFNAEKGYVLGIDAGRAMIRAMSANLLGEKVAVVKNDSPTSKSGREIISQICDVIDKVLKQSKISVEDLLCIGIGIPGIRDESKGKNLLAPFVEDWEDIKIKDSIENHYKARVIIENSVNLGAIGEKWKGASRGYSNSVYINYGIGIGSALIINGELYRGTNGAAGEVGYMTLDKYYLRRSYSEQGSLEEIISGPSILKKVKDLNPDDDGTLEEVFQMAKEKGSGVNGIVAEILIYFGMMLVNIVSLFNPEAIILSGGIGRYIFDEYLQELTEILQAHVPYVPKLLCSQLGDNANILGAVGMAIRCVNSDYKNLNGLAHIISNT